MRLTHTSYAQPRSPARPNEDATRVHQRDSSVIAALADGVGASREGGAAARRAVDMVVDYYLTKPQAWSPRRALAEFVRHINRTFFQESHLRHGSAELLCTLSVIVIEGGRLYGVNVGDSPAALYRKGRLVTLSEAHTVDVPHMSHGLTRAVGMEETIEPYAFETDLEDGDLLVVCSDGVSNVLREEQWLDLLAKRPSARLVVSRARELQPVTEDRDDAAAIVLDLVRRDWTDKDTRRPLEVLPDPSPGDKLEEFRVVRALQPGGRVWLATDAEGRKVVLKLPPLEAADDESRRDGYLREVWQATRINSPDFVRAFVPTGGTLRFYAMDYVEAPTLAEVLQSTGALHVEDAIQLGHFLLRACSFLLQRDHAHGDIKPENLLVLPPENGRLEFRMLDLGSSAELFSVTSRAGTPTYMAPERFHGAALSERTELYAIGVTLYQALTNVFPYGEVERFQTPRFDTTPKSLAIQNPAVTQWLESVVQRAVSAEPEYRYQNFSEMEFELSHPDKVAPFHRKNAPLLERDPVRFYKSLCFLLLLSNLFLIVRYVLR
jgi:serine/threonine protein phosphatase PrpC